MIRNLKNTKMITKGVVLMITEFLNISRWGKKVQNDRNMMCGDVMEQNMDEKILPSSDAGVKQNKHEKAVVLNEVLCDDAAPSVKNNTE